MGAPIATHRTINLISHVAPNLRWIAGKKAPGARPWRRSKSTWGGREGVSDKETEMFEAIMFSMFFKHGLMGYGFTNVFSCAGHLPESQLVLEVQPDQYRTFRTFP